MSGIIRSILFAIAGIVLGVVSTLWYQGRQWTADFHTLYTMSAYSQVHVLSEIGAGHEQVLTNTIVAALPDYVRALSQISD